MNWERALGDSVVVRLARRVGAALQPAAEPMTTRLEAVDAWLVSLVQGSWIYAWATAEPDPDPIVIDLRTSVLFSTVFAVTTRLHDGWGGSGLAAATERLRVAVERQPVRAASLLVGGLFTASLLASALSGELTAVTYGLHAAILGGSLLGLRERRAWSALRETRFGRVFRALFAPPEK